MRVAVAAMRGCVERVAEPPSVDALVVLGDFYCPRSVEALAGLGRRVYAVPGRFDDVYIARLAAERLRLLEGRLEYLGGGVYLAGVGGREPLMNIRGVAEALREARGPVLLASYYPARGVLDLSRAGVRRGLWELEGLLGSGAPVLYAFYSVCSEPGAQRLRGGVVHFCAPGASESWAVAELGW